MACEPERKRGKHPTSNRESQIRNRSSPLRVPELHRAARPPVQRKRLLYPSRDVPVLCAQTARMGAGRVRAVGQVPADLGPELILVRVGDGVLGAGGGVADLQALVEHGRHRAQRRGHQHDRRLDADGLAVAVHLVGEGLLGLGQAVDASAVSAPVR